MLVSLHWNTCSIAIKIGIVPLMDDLNHDMLKSEKVMLQKWMCDS